MDSIVAEVLIHVVHIDGHIIVVTFFPHPGGLQSDILFTFLHQMIRDETDASEIEEECEC